MRTTLDTLRITPTVFMFALDPFPHTIMLLRVSLTSIHPW
jgi:hypothetical protein